MESRSMDITAIDDPKELEMLGWHPIQGSSGYRSPFLEKRAQIGMGKTIPPAPAPAMPRCAARGRFAAYPVVRHQTPKENALLRCLASGRQRRVEGCTLGRSRPESSRDGLRHQRVHYLPVHSFAARDVELLVSIHRRLGSRLAETSRSVDGRASSTMEHRLSGSVPAAETGATATKDASCPPPAAVPEAMEADAESESPQQQHPLADVLASSLDSCTLASDAADPVDGSLALDLAFMSV